MIDPRGEEVDVELLVGSQFEHGVRLVGPVRPDVSWQAQANVTAAEKT